jgi:hypothetical protein
MSKFQKFFPITKVEEQGDGTLRVYGLVTEQKPDRDREVCVYEKTKPFYQATATEMLKATSVEGMESSIMPLREMHQLDAVGKGVAMDFDDANRSISMGFEVVAAETIKKVKKGVLPCFSHGGDYVGQKVASKEFPGCMEYVAKVGEVSLVDRGSLPGAVIQSIKGQSFEMQKANGSIELVKYALEDAPAKDDRLEKLTAEFDALKIAFEKSKPNPTIKDVLIADAAEKGITISEAARKVAKAYEWLRADPLQKGMWDVAGLAEVLATLAYACQSLQFEREMEGDESKVPEGIHGVLESLIGVYKELVDEETKELLAACSNIGKIEGSKTMDKLTAEQLMEKAKGALSHLHAAKAAVTSHHDKMVKMHKSHHDTMHDHIDKCVKAMGGTEAGGADQPDDEPESTSIEHGGTAHPHKALTIDDLKTFGEGLMKGVADLVDKKNEETVSNLLKALFPEAQQDAPAQTATGIGDRSQVPTKTAKVGQTHPVLKDNDANAGDPNKKPDTGTIKDDDVKAGFEKGDQDALLKLARSIAKPTGAPMHVVSAFQGRR